MSDLIRHDFGAALHVRAAVEGSEDRIIEGLVLPFGVTADVQDRDETTGKMGQPYRETIARRAVADLDPSTVTLESTVHGGVLTGRGIEADIRDDGVHMAFRVARTSAGNDLYELAREGVLTKLSAVFRPITQRRIAGGVVERTAIDIRRVAVLEVGAYPGAQVTAVRGATEGTMPEQDPQGAPAAPAETPAETPTAVDATRAAHERAAVAELTRGGPARQPIMVTRAEPVYGPLSQHNYLHDSYLAWRGVTEASERQLRHRAHLADIADAMERQSADRAVDPFYAERAGDLLSSEIPGAYPNDYLPGLLTPRILKGRPMADFYTRFPIADARPRIFAKVTTSGSVVVQSAEGAALGTTDIATTAVTVNPLMYGATIDVSRQVLDGGDPAALAIVFQDLLEAYSQASETVVKTAVEAGSTASGVAVTAATPYAGVLANVINYYAVRFKGAQGAFIPSALFPVLAAQGDTTGRPFLPMIGAVNSDGATLADDADLALAVLTARTKLSYASTANVCVFGRPSDFVIFESPIATVQYDQVVGPQAVRVGLWAYLVVGTRLGSLKVTAA